MNSPFRLSISVLGIYAGLLAIEHGIFEILQGAAPTQGLLINAIRRCQPENVWHACFPALTVLPNFLITGIVAFFLGLGAIIWAIRFMNKSWGMLLLSVLSECLKITSRKIGNRLVHSSRMNQSRRELNFG